MDEWGVYPKERQKLFELIKTTNANGVILLTGNVHFAELSKIEVGSYPIYEFTSSGLTHINDEYGKAKNSFRVGKPLIDLNFGLLEIDCEMQPFPIIKLKAVGLDGIVSIEYQVKLNELH
jgi:alkaline phosphatase D